MGTTGTLTNVGGNLIRGDYVVYQGAGNVHGMLYISDLFLTTFISKPRFDSLEIRGHFSLSPPAQCPGAGSS